MLNLSNIGLIISKNKTSTIRGRSPAPCNYAMNKNKELKLEAIQMLNDGKTTLLVSELLDLKYGTVRHWKLQIEREKINSDTI